MKNWKKKTRNKKKEPRKEKRDKKRRKDIKKQKCKRKRKENGLEKRTKKENTKEGSHLIQFSCTKVVKYHYKNLVSGQDLKFLKITNKKKKNDTRKRLFFSPSSFVFSFCFFFLLSSLFSVISFLSLPTSFFFSFVPFFPFPSSFLSILPYPHRSFRLSKTQIVFQIHYLKLT